MTKALIPGQVFHGTSYAFDRFEPRHLGACVRNPTTAFGFFFSKDAEDAEYWAHRAARYGRSGGAPRLITAAVRVDTPALISTRKFQFYLQRARVSTIQRDLNAWRDAGHDGITTIRDGVRWWAPFDAAAIRMISSRALSNAVEYEGDGHAAQTGQPALRSGADDQAP